MKLRLIDVQSATREVTLSGDVVRSIPTARSYNALLVLIPGVVTNVNDTVTGTATTSFPIHGGRTSEGRLSLDGLTVGSPPSGNSATSYVVDVGQAQEVTFTTAGGLGESETAGLTMNIVPKSGGNTMRGSLFASGTAAKFQSDNLTAELAAQGVTAATPLTKVYDVSGTVGGPIVTDRLWYFVNGAHRRQHQRERQRLLQPERRRSESVAVRARRQSPGVLRPDLRERQRPPHLAGDAAQQGERLLGRAVLVPNLHRRHGRPAGAARECRRKPSASSAGGSMSPRRHGRPQLTNRLFVEAGYGGIFFGVGNFEREPNPTRDLIRVAEQCASGCAANGNIPGLVYRSQDFSVAHTGSYLWKGSIAYVTGTHSLKIGYQHTLMTDDRQWFTNNQNLTYRVNNGEPNQLTQSISPWVNDARAGWDALFVQEQWTRGRLTLQGAVRFDRARSWFPAQQEGPSRFLPTPIVIPETRGVDSYKDITPRIGVAYDVFGTGRTAIKMTIGRYLEGAGVSGHYANTNPDACGCPRRRPRSAPQA